MSELLSISGRLATRDGRLLDSACAAVCCTPQNAIRFTECCDGDPVIWVLESLGAGCRVIHVGQYCYTNTGERATLASLAAAGVPVLSAFNGDDGCVSGCADPACRRCPIECCLTALLPGCRTDDVRRCCLLGSAYRIDYTERRTVRVWGYHCDQQYGGTCYVEVPGGCVGYYADPILEFESVLTTHTTHTGTDAFGQSCSGVQPTANRFYRRTGRRWVVDGYAAGGIPINGRYEDIDDRWQDDLPHFARGEMPTVAYLDVGDHGEACDGTTEFIQCERAGSDLDPCPSPDNPTIRITRNTISGSWNCDGGRQTLTIDDEQRFCPRTNPEFIARMLDVTVREWTVTILSRQGCEVSTCADANPGGSGGLIGPPSGGCVGCRSGPGL